MSENLSEGIIDCLKNLGYKEYCSNINAFLEQTIPIKIKLLI